MTREQEPVGTAAECKSCGAPMVWAISEKGKPIPFDVTPSPRGTFYLFRRPDKIEALYYMSKHASAEKARQRKQKTHQAHWASCLHAEQHRRNHG